MVITIITIIGLVITLLALFFSAYKWGYNQGQSFYKLKENIKRQELLLLKVYAPLRKLLIDCHITTVSFIEYHYFSMRWRRALPFLKRLKLKKFISTLFDQGVSTGTGLDYGDFDRQYIEKIVKNNIDICDAKLVILVQNALREEIDTAILPNRKGELTKQDLELIDHIYEQYAKLSKG